MAKKILMKGNEALAEAAVRVGCRLYCGYPITPQTEIMEYLSGRMPQVGGSYVQAESEVSAISMLFGAASTGYRVITASSGPGFSLKQEGISYIASQNLPAVIVDVCRYGSGLGLISPGQGDYFQATKGGGHGDYQLPVFAPHTIQESVDLIALAFDKAEEYLTPVILLTDGALGQMMEGVELPEMQPVDPEKPWALKGMGDGKARYYRTAAYDGPQYDTFIREKFKKMQENEQRYEKICVDDADVVLVAYGISARICKRAVKMGREKGMKIGLLRPISLWPFPMDVFKEVRKHAKAFLSVEMSAIGQMVEDVALAAHGEVPVYLLASGMNPSKEQDILKKAQDILDGKEKEVF